MWSRNKCQIFWLTSEAQDSIYKSVILILAMYQKHLCDILKMFWSEEGDYEAKPGRITRLNAGLF